MNLIRFLHLINSIVSGSIGAVASTILIFLILKKTAKEMKDYSMVLLQSTMLDMLLAISSVFLDAIVTVKNGRTYFIASELFRNSSIHLRFITTLIWGFSVIMMSNYLSVLYMYRYFMLTKYNRATLILYLKIMIAPVSSAIGYIVAFYFLMYPDSRAIQLGNEDLGYMLKDNQSDDIGMGFVFNIKQSNSVIIVCFLTLIFCTTYLIIIFCAIKILRYMKRSASLVGARTKAAQIELTKTLLFQTFMLVLTLFIPFLLLAIPTVFLLDIPLAQVIAFSVISWVPTMNSIVTIWIIKPYRMAIKHIFVKGSENAIYPNSNAIDTLNINI